MIIIVILTVSVTGRLSCSAKKKHIGSDKPRFQPSDISVSRRKPDSSTKEKIEQKMPRKVGKRPQYEPHITRKLLNKLRERIVQEALLPTSPALNHRKGKLRELFSDLISLEFI